MENIQEQVLTQCYHCGNKTLMNVEYKVCQHFGGVNINENSEYEYEMQEDFEWKLLSCPVCHFLTLFQIYTDESMQALKNGKVEQLYEKQVIYPENRLILNEVPREVSNAFESALKIKKIDRQICLISLRRTLELICKEKNANGKTLQVKINNLIKKNIFPKDLENAFSVIREYGNSGAHSDINLTDYQLNELIRILYSVIDYLYITPNKAVKMKEKLDEIKEAHKYE